MAPCKEQGLDPHECKTTSNGIKNITPQRDSCDKQRLEGLTRTNELLGSKRTKIMATKLHKRDQPDASKRSQDGDVVRVRVLKLGREGIPYLMKCPDLLDSNVIEILAPGS